ncbi:SigE family RNA polymerase sigma factor [Kribbella sp. NBC_01245]|uniref:SigE family RNA polymerase sigma factor n=1 Tax=Kribbella sp. NBC_01245 TaxID=2903578 RepID=UPI002E2D3569|nr:SigE family RNA polymerase sigma factor [Kribbella sp. NBC_01245]
MEYADFDDFVARGSRRLLGTAHLLAENRHTAEDLTQEALIQVFRAWPSIRSTTAVDSYAYRTLIRQSRRRWRHRSRGHEVLMSDVPDSPVSDGARHDADLSITVRERLAMLPKRQRETLTLRFYSDLSVEDTARVLGCSPGTVKSQTSKGLQNLRRLLVSPKEIHTAK